MKRFYRIGCSGLDRRDTHPAGGPGSRYANQPYDREKDLEGFGGSEDVFDQMAEVFMMEYESQLNEIVQTYEVQDFPRLSRAAHALKGTASTFCALAATELALDIEVQAKEGQVPQSATLLDRLRTETVRLAESLQAR